jgi:hemerythrin-like metal-binding protein
MGISDLLPNYTVNHHVMDEHHRALFNLIDRLNDAVLERNEHELIGEVLNSLLDYTKMHFAAEERLMHKADFPGLPQHKEAHDMLVAQVQELQRRHKQKDSALAVEISQFMLKDWLVKHILGMDELYAPYFKKAFPDAGKRIDAI